MNYPSLKRWLYVVLVLPVCGYFLLFLTLPVWRTISDYIFHLPWPFPFANIFSIAVLILGFCWFLNHMRGCTWSWRYPPAWFSGVIASSGFVLLEYDSGWIYSIGILTIVTFYIGGSWVWGKILRKYTEQCIKKKKQTPQPFPDPFKDFKSLNKWFMQEAPVERPEQDVFNHKLIAKRITRRLCGESMKSVALIGPYGSGKSTILKLTKYYLERPDEIGTKVDFKPENVIVCEVDSWGLKQESAVEYVLTQVVKALSKHADCLSLSGLPQQYRSLLDAGTPWASFLGSVLFRKVDPKESLERLDYILDAINRRLVIFVEDMDRNEDENLYNDISALLDRLHNRKAVSFVVVVGELSIKTDMLLRYSDTRESLPPVSKHSILEAWSLLESHCLNKTGINNPWSEKDRNKEYGFDVKPITILLDNPRTLKYALRCLWISWEKLRGEIDFIDLSILCSLEAAAPEAIKFISHHIQPLRGNYNEIDFESVSQEIENLFKDFPEYNRKNWEIYTENAKWPHRTAKSLLGYLFPTAFSKTSSDKFRLQGVAISYPTDYWKRYLDKELNPDEIPDQVVLSDISHYINNDIEPTVIVEKIFSKQDQLYDEKIKQFGYMINASKLRKLASHLFDDIVKNEKFRKPKYELGFGEQFYPGIEQLSRLMRNNSDAEYQNWLENEFEKAIPVNLRFVIELREHFAIRYMINCNNPHLDMLQLNESIIAKVDSCYSDVHVLIESLRNSDIWILINLINKNSPLSKWKNLADYLIQAASSNPQTIVPQLVPLVVGTNVGLEGEERYSWRKENENGIREMFGDNFKRMVELIAETELDVSSFDEEAKGIVKFAQDRAKRRLAEWEGELPVDEIPPAES